MDFFLDYKIIAHFISDLFKDLYNVTLWNDNALSQDSIFLSPFSIRVGVSTLNVFIIAYYGCRLWIVLIILRCKPIYLFVYLVYIAHSLNCSYCPFSFRMKNDHNEQPNCLKSKWLFRFASKFVCVSMFVVRVFLFIRETQFIRVTYNCNSQLMSIIEKGRWRQLDSVVNDYLCEETRSSIWAPLVRFL